MTKPRVRLAHGLMACEREVQSCLVPRGWKSHRGPAHRRLGWWAQQGWGEPAGAGASHSAPRGAVPPRCMVPQAHISLMLKSSPEISFFVGLHLPCRFNGRFVRHGALHSEDIRAPFILADKSCPFQQQGVKSDFPSVFSGHKPRSWCLPGRKPKPP